MYGDYSVTLGFVPTRRGMFNKQAALKNKEVIRKAVDALVEADDGVRIVDIDWLNEDGFLIDEKDVRKVADHFRKEKVDALFICHCDFGSEEVVGKLGKALGKPVLLWGPRDEAPPGDFSPRQTDTQCGLFASSKSLLRHGVPFTYIENCKVTDKAFTEGFRNFLGTACVVKAFNSMRIGQISVRPKSFQSTMVNESELLERFGIEVIPINTVMLRRFYDRVVTENTRQIDELTSDILARAKLVSMDESELKTIAALELTFKALADEYELSAIASECWMTYYNVFGVRPCFLFGDVTDRWLPVSCETDIHGSISSVLLRAAARGQTPNFLADLTIRHPENDNGELLWHCGPFPLSLARENSAPEIVGGVGRWEIRGGDITILRFDGCRGSYSLFTGLARGIEGPATNGNYLWIETDDWVKWEKKFIYGPYIHHVAAIHGNYTDIIGEACKYMPGVTLDLA